MQWHSKIYVVGLALVEYIGEHPTPLVGNSLREKAVLEKGDFFVTTPEKAVGLCGGTNYRYVKEVSELTAFIGLDASIEGESETKETPLNKERVMHADIKEIKQACKQHKITIGNKKREELIALLLPYLS